MNWKVIFSSACLFLGAPLWASWLETATPVAGAALLQIRTTNRQVMVRIRTGESVARTVAFFVRRDAPFRELADLTNAVLVDRARTTGGSTTFLPEENGTYYAAAILYVSIENNRQNYALLVTEEGAEVDWVPPKAPPMPFFPPPLLPTNEVATPAVSEEKPMSAAPPPSPASNAVNPSNVVAEKAAAPASNAAPTPVQVSVQWPTNYFYPWMAAMGNAQGSGDRVSFSAKEFLGALTNLLREQKPGEPPRPERDRYFSRDPDNVDLDELSACARELRDLYGALARHRRDALPVTESEVYPLLIAYANAVVGLEQCLVHVMQRGIKLAEVERLQSEFTEVNRELLELWRRVDARLKEAVLGTAR